MKGSRVPWITTGRYVGASSAQENGHDGSRSYVSLLNRGLAPLDESRFLDQFEIFWKGSKADSRSPHPVRAAINAAMETATLEPTPHHCLALLESIFSACRQMCLSKSFREKLPGEKASFFAPLPMEQWDRLLTPLESNPEFRIARSLASITGLRRAIPGAILCNPCLAPSSRSPASARAGFCRKRNTRHTRSSGPVTTSLTTSPRYYAAAIWTRKTTNRPPARRPGRRTGRRAKFLARRTR